MKNKLIKAILIVLVVLVIALVGTCIYNKYTPKHSLKISLYQEDESTQERDPDAPAMGYLKPTYIDATSSKGTIDYIFKYFNADKFSINVKISDAENIVYEYEHEHSESSELNGVCIFNAWTDVYGVESPFNYNSEYIAQFELKVNNQTLTSNLIKFTLKEVTWYHFTYSI